jgi:predicted nucleic acid-binding protein
VARSLLASAFLPPESIEAITVLRAAAIVAPLTVDATGAATLPLDDFILAAAVASGAPYLVTGDRKLRAIAAFQGVTTLNPREFLARLESEASA